jgi:hypothetical protein
MLWTSMPKAAIHEYGQALAAEDKIGFAWQRLTPSPAGDAVGTENGGEAHFRGPISG